MPGRQKTVGRLLNLIGMVAATGILSACASVPRGPAADLADAGIAATSAFSTDVRQTASQIRYIDVSTAFAATYKQCSVNPAVCGPLVQSGETYQKRLELAKTIELRAKAIDALGKAYKALKVEAGYDARADLVGATNSAIEGVNNFATAAFGLNGLVAAPLQKIAGLGAGLLADRSQRRRIVAGSQAIAQATGRLKDALEQEATTFDSLAVYIEKNRTDAKLALLSAGLASNNEVLLPLTASLGLKPVTGVDAVVAKSLATQTAVQAMLEAQSHSEVQAIRNKYRASIGALGALVEAHGELEADRGVSLADVERFLGELDVALGAKKED